MGHAMRNPATCDVTSKNSDQPAHACSLIGIFAICMSYILDLGQPYNVQLALWSDCMSESMLVTHGRRLFFHDTTHSVSTVWGISMFGYFAESIDL